MKTLSLGVRQVNRRNFWRFLSLFYKRSGVLHPVTCSKIDESIILPPQGSVLGLRKIELRYLGWLGGSELNKSVAGQLGAYGRCAAIQLIVPSCLWFLCLLDNCLSSLSPGLTSNHFIPRQLKGVISTVVYSLRWALIAGKCIFEIEDVILEPNCSLSRN